MATFIACLALLLTSILPLLMFLLIKQNLIGQITNSLQFGTVTQGLKRDTHFKQLLHTLGLLKWQLTIIVLVLLRNHPSQQLQLLIPLSILYQTYLIRYQPYESSTENKFCLFNELLVSSVLYLYIVASDYNEVIEMRDYSGLGIIGVISICIIVNFGKFIDSLVREIKRKVPMFLHKLRQRGVKKYLGETEMAEVTTNNALNTVEHAKPVNAVALLSLAEKVPGYLEQLREGPLALKANQEKQVEERDDNLDLNQLYNNFEATTSDLSTFQPLHKASPQSHILHIKLQSESNPLKTHQDLMSIDLQNSRRTSSLISLTPLQDRLCNQLHSRIPRLEFDGQSSFLVPHSHSSFSSTVQEKKEWLYTYKRE
ncbi:hypothetical protein FGO68_gene5421 [Halteria grandinella]|uniref:Uncharacterized protein n=1 Tax=Halteria grandinella TaxID=5974 RepID=A0A8J8P6Z3_HALGN|nr:hypothetical protein FGO68_gene5421 [Halteria grandinella]